MAIRTPCYRCGKLSLKTYCSDHVPAWVTRSNRRSPIERGYDATYQRNRKELLASLPTCRRCNRQGTLDNPITADHIVSLHNGGTNDLANLQPLCRQCNSRKQ